MDPDEYDQEELEGLMELDWSGSDSDDFEDMEDDADGAEAGEDDTDFEDEEEDWSDDDVDMADSASDVDQSLPDFATMCSSRGITYITGELHKHTNVLSSTCHPQTADSLVASPHINEDGSEEIMVAHGNRISLYKLQKDPSKAPEKFAEGAAPTLPYSQARSPDGRIIATTSEQGLLTLFQLVPSKPPASSAPAAPHYPFTMQHFATLACWSPSRPMNNCVRFGTFAGKQRILVASQDGHVFLLKPPKPGADGQLPDEPKLADFLVPQLPSFAPQQLPSRAQSSSPQQRKSSSELSGEALLSEEAFTVEDLPRMDTTSIVQLKLGPTVNNQRFSVNSTDFAAAVRSTAASVRSQTACIAGFPCPVNTAQPSPDGRFLAVGLDAPTICLLPACEQYHQRQMRLLHFGTDFEPDTGSQYCAFNASCSMVAASSDTLRVVCVWGTATGQLLYRLYPSQSRPCLALSFVPNCDHLLVYAEDRSRVHIVDLLQPGPAPERGRAAALAVVEAAAGGGGAAAQQQQQDTIEVVLHLPRVNAMDHVQVMMMFMPLLHNGNQITGMGISPSGKLLLAGCTSLHVCQLAQQQWSVQQHKMCPQRFKAAVRALLMCAHSSQEQQVQVQQRELQSSICSVPVELLVREVVPRLVGRWSEWAEPGV